MSYDLLMFFAAAIGMPLGGVAGVFVMALRDRRRVR